MKNKIALLTLIGVMSLPVMAQKLSTRNGYVKFFSETPIENIAAENNIVSSVIDLSSGQFAFLVQIKAFQFEKALMQEHFNENYMESGEFPKASFKGSIQDFQSLDLTKNGSYTFVMKGSMLIHGTTKEIAEEIQITVKDGKVFLNSKFMLRPEDYGVKIPASKRDNISESVEVTVKMSYDRK